MSSVSNPLRFSSGHFGPGITALDVLKTLAVITMIIDHIGYYFFLDETILCAIGRMSFPIWLFLVGYARSRDLGPDLIVGCLLVQIAGVISGMDVLPINILGTILLVRLTLDHFAHKLFRADDQLMIGTAILSLMIIPTYILCEYGTAAWLAALMGYALRHWERVRAQVGRLPLIVFLSFAGGVVAASQYITFLEGASVLHKGLGAGFVLVGLSLSAALAGKGHFARTEQWARPVRGFFHICGRHTLAIYVIHLIVFRLLAAHLQVEGFGWFAGGISPLG